MSANKNRKIIGKILVLLLFTPLAFSQYKVEGGSIEPILAASSNILGNRMEVYLVYGAENVSISYTSSSGSHTWYRYHTRISERERIQSTQQGTTSVISNVEDGYGYGVIEGEEYISATYIWIIDYSKYPVNIQNLVVNPNIDPCMGFQLDGNDLTPALTYRTPAGVETTIPRKYEISYSTLIWNETNKRFDTEQISEEVENPIRSALRVIPLQDTEIRVRGDLFARHFGVEKEYVIDHFEASKVEAHAEAIVIISGSSNIASTSTEDLSPCDRELNAPVEIRFTAVANTPVASLFRWKVVTPNSVDTLYFLFEEFEYTFHQAGDYQIYLEVSTGRNGKCTDENFSCSFSITETEMRVPNAFTPVGSPGINDVFKVGYKSVVSFKGWIFNRWGSELFHWNDPAQGWDGKYRGKYVPAGPYFYVIEYTGTDGKKRKKSGDVNVIHVKDGINITE